MKKRRNKLSTKPLKLGAYPLGFNFVDVWLDPKMWGGSFSWASVRGGNTTIVIGIANEEYASTLAVTLHEAMELLSVEMGIRFTPSDGETEASDCYQFIMNHNQFSELLARTAKFIQLIQVDLMTAHSRYHPKK